jgi:hypothetical protein
MGVAFNARVEGDGEYYEFKFYFLRMSCHFTVHSTTTIAVHICTYMVKNGKRVAGRRFQIHLSDPECRIPRAGCFISGKFPKTPK